MKPGQGTPARIGHEVAHGRVLAAGSTEEIWGWGTPAGRLRAARRAEMIVRLGRCGPGVLALEVGCGTGLFTELVSQSGCRIVANDVSPDLLRIAAKRGLDSSRVSFIEGPVETCELARRSFDVVFGSSVLHHLDLEPALTRFVELLGPGGRLVFTEPNMMNPQIFIERHVPFVKRALHVSPDETAFFRWEVARALELSGLVGVEVRPFDFLHPWTPRPAIPLVRRLGAVLEGTPLLREIAGSLVISASKKAS